MEIKVRPDTRNQIYLKKLKTWASQYKISLNKNKEIILTPVPEGERIVICDKRSRVYLGEHAEGVDIFEITTTENEGELKLTPFVEVPKK